MTQREQFLRVCRWNRDLARENARLRSEQAQTVQECRRLRTANADAGTQLVAAQALLGAAIDAALQGVRP